MARTLGGPMQSWSTVPTVAEIREKNKFTKQKMCAILGCNSVTLDRWESGTTTIRKGNAKNIAKIFGAQMVRVPSLNSKFSGNSNAISQAFANATDVAKKNGATPHPLFDLRATAPGIQNIDLKERMARTINAKALNRADVDAAWGELGPDRREFMREVASAALEQVAYYLADL